MPAGFLILLIYHVCILKLYVFLVISVPILDNLIKLTQLGFCWLGSRFDLKCLNTNLRSPPGYPSACFFLSRFLTCDYRFVRLTALVMGFVYSGLVVIIAPLYTMHSELCACQLFLFPPMLNYFIINNLIFIKSFKIAFSHKRFLGNCF